MDVGVGSLLFTLVSCLALTFLIAVGIAKLRMWLQMAATPPEQPHRDAEEPAVVISFAQAWAHKQGLSERDISTLGHTGTYEELFGAQGSPGQRESTGSKESKESKESKGGDVEPEGSRGSGEGREGADPATTTTTSRDCEEASGLMMTAPRCGLKEQQDGEHDAEMALPASDGVPRECPVCLSEFQQADVVRLLHCCSNCFHKSCIDSWLRSKSSCPLCRTAFQISPPADADQAPATPTSVAPEAPLSIGTAHD